MRILLILSLCFIAANCFLGCTRTENTALNLSKWTDIYQITLDSYLEQDTALNENIDFIAIDMTTLEFANDSDKNAIVSWFEANHVPVKDTNLNGLKEKGLFDGKFIRDGVFLKIIKVTENNDEIMIEGLKYRGTKAANWYETKWQLNNDTWEFIETVLTMIS
jgi:hypothetical protein